MYPKTIVEILDRSLNKIAEVRALYPLNEQGMVLRYSKELSDYGEAMFRVATEDPLFTQYGDILEPHKYHVRIRRANGVVWQGAIVDNPRRTHEFIEVKAYQYLFYLNKIRVRRNSSTIDSINDNGKGLHYRLFTSGTLISNVQTVIQQAATDFSTNHILSDLAVGDLENPNYPSGFTQADGVTPLVGSWEFSEDNLTLAFDYHSVLYVLKAFGIYAQCDFQVNDDLTFDFKPYIGQRRWGVTFRYGTQGNIYDYDLPRLGSRMANDLIGIGSTLDGEILHVNKTDSESINEYGLMQESAAYTDVKDNNNLQTRVGEELRFIKRPEVSPVNVYLTEKAYPFEGMYDIGDVVTVEIKDSVIDYTAPKRIVGITVSLHNTGRELTTLQTNDPRQGQDGVGDS